MIFGVTEEAIEAVECAAQTIDEEALALRQAHTMPPEFTDWGGDIDAQTHYEAMKAQVAKLYALAERLRGR